MTETDLRTVTIFPDAGHIYRYTLASGDNSAVEVDMTLTCCDNPDCACRDMTLFMKPVSEASWMEPGSEVSALVNADSGEVVSMTDGCTQQLRDSLTATTRQDPFLGFMRERWRRVKLLGEADAWRKQDWSWWEPGVLIRWRDAFPGEFDDIVTVDDTMFMVDDNYCCNPKCQCAEVVISFLEVNKNKDAPLKIDPVVVDLKKWRAAGQDNQPMSMMQRRLWQACATIPDLKKTLRERRERMLGIGGELHRLAEDRNKKMSPSTAAKVGRNAPCPCGSGKKFKRCCGAP